MGRILQFFWMLTLKAIPRTFMFYRLFELVEQFYILMLYSAKLGICIFIRKKHKFIFTDELFK